MDAYVGQGRVDRDSHRLAEIRRITTEISETAEPSAGDFSALGMLITDASLTGDGPALEAAHDGLQWLYRRYSTKTETVITSEAERRGRVLGLIDTTHWSLRRLPATLQLGLHPDGHASRFLLAVAGEPGISNSGLAERLGVDDTEISRVGRRLLAAGVVWRRKEWRHNAWDITPRGQQYLEVSGLLGGNHPSAELPEDEPVYGVGVKVLVDALVGAVVDRHDTVLSTQRRVLPPRLNAADVVTEVAAFVGDLVARHTDHADPTEWVVGIELGGHVARGGQVVYAPNYGDAGWAGLDLGDRVARKLGLRVVVNNDANAYARYEYTVGDNIDLGCSATVIVDEGVGCGIISDGALLQGARGGAGEVGHILVQPGGRLCRCGNRGCLESLASVPAIVDALAENSGRPRAAAPSIEAVANLANDHDEPAIDALRQAGRALGQALSAVLNLFDPEQVVLYAPAPLTDENRDSAAATTFLTALRESSTRHAFSTASNCRIVTKPYDAHTGAHAAATVALVQFGATVIAQH